MKRAHSLLILGMVVLATAIFMPRTSGAISQAMAQGAAAPAEETSPVEKMVTSAKAPAEHSAVAEEYLKEAKEAGRKAKMYRRLAKAYARDGVMAPSLAAHESTQLANHYDTVAAHLTKLAKAHQDVATKPAK